VKGKGAHEGKSEPWVVRRKKGKRTHSDRITGNYRETKEPDGKSGRGCLQAALAEPEGR